MTTASVEALPTGPAPDGNDTEFWQGLRDGQLVLPRCTDCGEWRSLGRPLCASCWSFATTWTQVAPRGTVYTWIRSHRDFMSELDVAAPYVTILVQLDEPPVRLLGILTGEQQFGPAIGDPVAGVIEHPAHAEWPVLRWARAEAV